MITLTPLSSSASSSSSHEPVCYLLELDDARIMLDMGQQDYRTSSTQASWQYEEKVRELAPTLSLVLLSHSPTTYLSLYPYARARWGLTCPVYATQPTVEMGRVVCLSEAESWRSEHPVGDIDGQPDNEKHGEGSNPKGKRPLRGPFVPTVEEIHEAFDWIKPIRYIQPIHLGGDLSHLLLTPFPSGHTLGGTLFKLRSPTSGTVLYAVGINHTGERHLDGMVTGQGGATGYDEGVMRPDLLLVEGGRSLVANPKRRDREGALIDLVTSTLESNHSLLLPCDPSPRLLELLVLLDQHWSFKVTPSAKRDRQSNPPPQSVNESWPYPLCLVSRTAQDMVAFARSLLEWMGGVVRENGGAGAAEDVVGALTGQGRKVRRGKRVRQTGGAMGSESGALDFAHVKFFSSPEELIRTYPLMRPKLVLAIPPTMSHGPSRFLFTAMANTEGNVILLTTRGEDGTLTRQLYEQWEKKQDQGVGWGKGRIGRVGLLEGNLEIEMNSKVHLMGAELEAHLEVERLQKEREAAQQAALDRSKRMLEADDLESDSDSDSEAGEVDEGLGGMVVAKRTEGANAYAGDGEDVRTMSFDIFVKGQQMRVGRGGDGGEGAMARFRMFPYIERRGRKVDTYGEGLDIGQWVRKGREIEEEGETEEVREAKRRKLEEEEREKVPPEPPSKYVSEKIHLELKASVFFVDMDGLHDGQAIKTIISDLQPRKLILIRSDLESTKALHGFLESSASVTKDIFAPQTGETVQIGEHVQSFSIMLGDSISSSTKWAKFEGYEVAMVDGKIAFSAGSTVPTLEASVVELPPVSKEEAVKPEPVSAAPTQSAGEPIAIDDDSAVKQEPGAESEDVQIPPSKEAKLEAPTSIPAVPKLPGSMFIGDLRLTTLKARLATLGIPAEFAGEGVLVCGPGVVAQDTNSTVKNEKEGKAIVAVRKLAEGKIVLEGAVGKTYFDVRRELYAGYAQV